VGVIRLSLNVVLDGSGGHHQQVGKSGGDLVDPERSVTFRPVGPDLAE
jgi:hypothetical protein